MAIPYSLLNCVDQASRNFLVTLMTQKISAVLSKPITAQFIIFEKLISVSFFTNQSSELTIAIGNWHRKSQCTLNERNQTFAVVHVAVSAAKIFLADVSLFKKIKKLHRLTKIQRKRKQMFRFF